MVSQELEWERNRRAQRGYYQRNRGYYASKRKDFRATRDGSTGAHSAVARALRSGALVRRACEQCGAPNTDAHHDDYSQPLSVRWLCKSHHRLAHRRAAEVRR